MTSGKREKDRRDAMDAFARIAERKIKEAMAKGEFDNLPGKGRPLHFDDDSNVPEELRVAYRVLKNAGCIPPELELHKEIMTLRDLMNSVHDEEEKRKLVRKLNFKIVKLEMMRGRPFALDIFPEYRDKIVKKMEGGKD